MEFEFETARFGDSPVTDPDALVSKIFDEMDHDRNGYISRAEVKATRSEAKDDVSLRFDMLKNLSNDEWGRESKVSRADLRKFAVDELKKKSVSEQCYKSFEGLVTSGKGKAIFAEMLDGLARGEFSVVENAWRKAHGDQVLVKEVGEALSQSLQSRGSRWILCTGGSSIAANGSGLLTMNSAGYETQIETGGDARALALGWTGTRRADQSVAFAELHIQFLKK